MNILVTGLNGFVGQAVKLAFEASGHVVGGVPRAVLMAGGEPLDVLVSGADIVINLAGANLFGRWTEEYKRLIMSSRQMGTRNMADSINRVNRDKEPETGVKLFISASAVGIYPAGAFCDEETMEAGTDFLAGVVESWEHEARQVRRTRTVITRFGVIVGKEGGVIQKLMPLIRSRLAFVAGSGKQPLPVILLDDVVGFMLYAVEYRNVEGIYNLVIPQEVDFRGFVEALSRVRPPLFTFSVPERLLKLVMGDSAVVLTDTAHVNPRRLMASGYELKCRTMDEIARRIGVSL